MKRDFSHLWNHRWGTSQMMLFMVLNRRIMSSFRLSIVIHKVEISLNQIISKEMCQSQIIRILIISGKIIISKIANSKLLKMMTFFTEIAILHRGWKVSRMHQKTALTKQAKITATRSSGIKRRVRFSFPRTNRIPKKTKASSATWSKSNKRFRVRVTLTSASMKTFATIITIITRWMDLLIGHRRIQISRVLTNSKKLPTLLTKDRKIQTKSNKTRVYWKIRLGSFTS